MIAKLLVRAGTREDAINKMLYALDEFIIEGVPTTVDYQKKILSHPDFISGNFDTSFIEKLTKEEKEMGKKTG
jgi:acetyl-CoA carboxylase biotin carboxylase subunit